MNGFLLAAAVAAVAIAALHIIAGGRYIARPLLDSALRPVPKLTNYFCWHIVSLVIIALAAAYLRAALVPGSRELAAVATGLSASVALLNAAIVVTQRQSPKLMPQWALFALLTGLGVLGLRE